MGADNQMNKKQIPNFKKSNISKSRSEILKGNITRIDTYEYDDEKEITLESKIQIPEGFQFQGFKKKIKDDRICP